MSYRFRLLLQMWIIVVIAILLSQVITYRNARQRVIESTVKSLDAFATLYSSKVQDAIDRNFERFDLIVGRVRLKETLKDVQKNDREEILNQIMRDALRVLDDVEMLLIAGPDRSLLGYVGRQTSSEYLPHIEKELALSEWKKGIRIIDYRKGEGHVLISGPIFDGDELLGTLHIIAAYDFLEEIVRSSKIIGKSAEVVIAEQHPTGAVSVIVSTFAETGSKVAMKMPDDVPLAHAFRKEESIFLDLSDVRGIPVLAVTRNLPDVNWAMVLKIDRAEIEDEIARLAEPIILFSFFILLATAFVMGVVIFYIFTPISGLGAVITRIAEDPSEPVDPVLLSASGDAGSLANSLERLRNKIILERVTNGTVELPGNEDSDVQSA